MAGLIACQPDAIVSRVLLKTAAGNVTLFAFDAGQELSEHTSPMQALLQVIEGEAVVTIAGRVHPLTAGQVFEEFPEYRFEPYGIAPSPVLDHPGLGHLCSDGGAVLTPVLAPHGRRFLRLQRDPSLAEKNSQNVMR